MAILKSLDKEKRKLRNVLADTAEWASIKKNAKKYANGNVSGWIREAAMNYVPKKSELK